MVAVLEVGAVVEAVEVGTALEGVEDALLDVIAEVVEGVGAEVEGCA